MKTAKSPLVSGGGDARSGTRCGPRSASSPTRTMHHRSGAVDLSARRKGHTRGSPVGLRRNGYHATNLGRSGAVYERRHGQG